MSDNRNFRGWGSPGIAHVGSYQVSGTPYLTGALLRSGQEMRILFPRVTKSVTVVASGAYTTTDEELRVHFNPAISTGEGSSNVVEYKHYVGLNTENSSVTFNTKCKEIWVTGIATGGTDGFQCFAELTHIPTSSMYALTGSGLTDVPPNPYRVGVGGFSGDGVP